MRMEPADPYPPPPAGVPPSSPADAGRVRVTAVGEHSVHWLEFGRGPECLALVHGLSGSTRWWSRNVQALSRRYRLLVPDVIGFGRSRAAGAIPAVPELAAVLAGWMSEAADGAPMHVVGHSMGGQLAIHVAARHPERIRRLVLVDAAGLPRPLNPRFLMRFAYDVLPPRRWGDPRFLPVIVGDALTAGPRVLLRALLHVLRDDVRPLLPRISAPTLVVWGARDALVPHAHGEQMRRAIPDARLLVLPGACHNPMVDRPEAFNRAVLSFLAGGDVGT
jgi:pimeloyl-ACP methyl ester carboxylesterase